MRINAERPVAVATDFGAVIARYEEEEAIKPMLVEDWLKTLKLAPKTRGHIRSLMHTIFDCAERWELIEKNPIKLVRVKGSSKRQKTPRVLTPEQFCLLPPMIVEPYRTQV